MNSKDEKIRAGKYTRKKICHFLSRFVFSIKTNTKWIKIATINGHITPIFDKKSAVS
jgi:hypothetical protein